MSFAGLPKPEDRADVIAYLETLQVGSRITKRSARCNTVASRFTAGRRAAVEWRPPHAAATDAPMTPSRRPRALAVARAARPASRGPGSRRCSSSPPLAPRRPRAARRRRRPTDAGRIITSHGISIFGDLKYPADFEHFDYVNPDAPQGRHHALPRHRRQPDLRQPEHLHPEGRAGAGPGPSLRQPADRLARRAGRRPTA